MRPTVHDFLSQSATAFAAAHLGMGAERSVTVWENHDDEVSYEAPERHTFSLYLQGGTGTSRLDKGALAGWQGAVCVMPEGEASDWKITEPFRFVHLYVSDKALRAAFSEVHECDARQLDLRDETFVAAPSIALPLFRIAEAAMAQDALKADEAFAVMVAHLTRGAPVLKGGLSPHQLRRVDEWVRAHMDGVIHLEDLAALTGLSVFHFHRMFKLARGMAPSEWVMMQRINLARQLLRAGETAAGVSAACGFANQSHMTRAFRKQTGMTPGHYRELAAGAAGQLR